MYKDIFKLSFVKMRAFFTNTPLSPASASIVFSFRLMKQIVLGIRLSE